MPIHYVCVACREEVYLPDSKAGTLQGCPRCRLKFLAPGPNVQVVPAAGASPAPARPAPARPAAPPSPAPASGPPGSSSRPSFAAAAGSAPRAPAPQPARPAPAPGAHPARPAAAPPGTVPAHAAPAAPARGPAPPPSYPRDAAKPPLYPLDGGAPAPAARAPAPAARPAPAKPGPAPRPPAAAATPGLSAGETPGVFGLHSTEVPALFGSDEEVAAEPGELFADAIPSAPDAELDEELDIPIDMGARPRPRPKVPGAEVLDESDDDDETAADEGGGVAVPEESDAVAAVAQSPLETDRLGMPEPALDEAASAGEIGLEANAAALSSSDALISMDDIFAAPKGAKPALSERPAESRSRVEGPAARPPAPPAKSAAPAFGTAGVLPAPFLKPAAGGPAPAGGTGPRPFSLHAVEGIADGPFQLAGGEVYLLGRDKDAQVKILSTSVSRRHARIDATTGEHVLIDLGSANGTQVNGQSVARHPLKDGDIIRMGKVLLRYSPQA